MKRLLALLLAMVLCFSLVACNKSSGGSSIEEKLKKQKEKEEEDEVDESAAFLVGEWARISTYSYFGGTKILQAEYFELEAGGNWKYSAKDKTLTRRGSSKSLVEVDGQVVAQCEYVDEWDGWYFRVVENCPVCSNICVGTWEQLTDYPERTTAQFREDGTVTVNGEEHTWKSICGPDAHFIEVSDYGVVQVNPHAAIMSLMDRTFYRNNELTFIEITPDNWTEYFSADFNFNFDMHYHTQKNTYGDEWEQRVVQDVYIWPYLKWRDNLIDPTVDTFMGDYNQLMVEYSYEEGTQSFTLDDQGNVLPGEIIQENRERHTDTLYIQSRQWYIDSNDENPCITYSGDLYGWGERDISQPVSVKIPKRILRMKGWIAVKDVNAIPEPIQPPPEEGNEIGMLCYNVELPVITADKFAEETLTPAKTGKVTIIAFWEQGDTTCVEQLIPLNSVAEQYGEQITAIAVHESYSLAEVQALISSEYAESRIQFLADNPREYRGEFGSLLVDMYTYYPYTLVLDENGMITHIFDYAASYDELKTAVETNLQQSGDQ